MIDLHHAVTQELLLGRRVQQVLTSDDRRAFAGQRVMKADLLGGVGETYWLDMGTPVKLMTVQTSATMPPPRPAHLHQSM